MLTLSAHSARAMAQAVLSAHDSHRYHDLVSWASRPLEQRIQSLVRPDQSNLKELLVHWDGQPSFDTATLPAQPHLEELIALHFKFSAHQPHLATPPPPSIMNCTAWESAPVFQRELDAETVMALVPVGRFSPSELWGIVLLAEQVNGAGVGVACEQAGELTWKYHQFTVISEAEMSFSDSWRCLDNQGSLFTSPQQRQQHSHQRSPPTVSCRSVVVAAEDDDSDDEYWGQYGDVEDSPTEESAHSGSTPFTRGFTMAVEEEEEDDDEYWRKYGEAQGEEQDESDKKPKTRDEDPSSEVAILTLVDHDPRHVIPTDLPGPESGRILACVKDTEPRARSTLVAPVAAIPVPGQVNPTTLAMLLERLVAHDDDPSPDKDVGGTENMDKDNAGEADVSLPSSSSLSALSWSSSPGSRSRSQSLSTSISSTSTSTGTTATTITTSIKSATTAQDNGPQTATSAFSTSPRSAVSCADSAFHEYCSPSAIAPDEFRKETKVEDEAASASTTTTKESVRQSLQSVVRKASISGLSKTELLEMLSAIFEKQEQSIQA